MQRVPCTLCGATVTKGKTHARTHIFPLVHAERERARDAARACTLLRRIRHERKHARTHARMHARTHARSAPSVFVAFAALVRLRARNVFNYRFQNAQQSERFLTPSNTHTHPQTVALIFGNQNQSSRRAATNYVRARAPAAKRTPSTCCPPVGVCYCLQ